MAIFLLCFFPVQLALKHRQGKNHKMRIIAFVGSPVEDNEKDVRFKVFYYISCQSHRKECCFHIMGLTHFSVVTVSVLFHLFFLLHSTPADAAACQAGKALEERESECGYH